MAEAQRIPHGTDPIALAAFVMAQKIMFVVIDHGVLSPQEASEVILECARFQEEMISLTPEHKLASGILKSIANKLRDHSPQNKSPSHQGHEESSN
jgi:hypothetical protein